MSAAAIIAIRRKKLIGRFRKAGATNPQHAVAPEALGERRSWVFKQLLKHGVLVPTQDGRFFMDDRAATEFLRQRRNRALVIGAIFLLVFLSLLIAGLIRH